MTEKHENTIEKLKEKLVSERKAIDGRFAKLIEGEVVNQLLIFAEQDEELAEVVLDHPRSFKQCMDAVMKDIGYSISDIDAYRRAVKFYFPEWDVECSMKLTKPGKQKILNISFADLID